VVFESTNNDFGIEFIFNITKFSPMLIGAVGAIMYKKNCKAFLFIADNKITQMFCWLIIALLGINKYHIASIVDGDIVSVVALLLVVGQINVKNRIVNLETPIFQYLGKISYGIYVIHIMVIFFLSKYLLVTNMPSPLSYIAVFSSVIILTIALAHLSYKYYESYFLRKKKKFEIVRSSSTAVI